MVSIGKYKNVENKTKKMKREKKERKIMSRQKKLKTSFDRRKLEKEIKEDKKIKEKERNTRKGCEEEKNRERPNDDSTLERERIKKNRANEKKSVASLALHRRGNEKTTCGLFRLRRPESFSGVSACRWMAKCV